MATNNAASNHRNLRNFARNGKEVGEWRATALWWWRKASGAKGETRPQALLPQRRTHEPHLPIESDPKFMELYKEFDDDGIRRTTGATQIDHAFGKLMKALDEFGETENTFVIFTSDNGPREMATMATRGSTVDFVSGSVPPTRAASVCPVSYAGPQVPAGTTNRTPIIGSDASTIWHRGIPLPDDRTIDGVDIRPVFAEKPVKRPVPLYYATTWLAPISTPRC